MAAAVDSIQKLSEVLSKQAPWFYFIYIILFASILINSVLIFSVCKKQQKWKAFLLLVENIFLSLAMLAGCMLNVFLMDALGQRAFEAFDSTNNTFLIFCFLCMFLCLIDFIVIIYHTVTQRKQKRIQAQKESEAAYFGRK